MRRLIGSRSSTSDVNDINDLGCRVDVKKNPIVSDTATPCRAFGFQASNIAAKWVLLHCQQSGAELTLVLRGSYCELFLCAVCDVKCPGHGGVAAGLRSCRV